MIGIQSINDVINPNVYQLVEQIKKTSISDNLPIRINEFSELFKKLHDTICLFFNETQYFFLL